jgi:hypothetical protein
MTTSHTSILAALGFASLLAHPAYGQECTAIPFSQLGSLHGHAISALTVTTSSPDKLPGATGALGALHVRTSEGTIRRQFLLREGEAFDTLRAIESIHRLKRQSYLADASLELDECVAAPGETPTVALHLTTRDSWSTRPSIKVRSSSAATIGLEERNVLGTGRSIKTYVGSDAGRTGVGIAYSDPWIFNSPLSATLSRNVFRDGHDWRASLGTRERSVFDRWNADISLLRSERVSPATLDSLRRVSGSFVVARRLFASRTGATSLLAGFEGEKTELSVSRAASTVGPSAVRRTFAGLDLGLAHHSALYQTVDWYLPNESPADLPLGFEAEGVVGFGRDFAANRRAVHVDFWGGRMWMPTPALLVISDVWVSGYARKGGWDAGSNRGALSLFKRAPRGMWTMRIAGEQLTDPDPDVRALATVDLTSRALPKRSRLAESAVAASLERSAHLFGLTRGYVLDGALFGAVSSRWDPAAMNAGRISIAALGVGLRLAPTRLGSASIRFDVGYPIASSGGVAPRRPFFGITLSPWIEAGRSRGSASIP